MINPTPAPVAPKDPFKAVLGTKGKSIKEGMASQPDQKGRMGSLVIERNLSNKRTALRLIVEDVGFTKANPPVAAEVIRYTLTGYSKTRCRGKKVKGAFINRLFAKGAFAPFLIPPGRLGGGDYVFDPGAHDGGLIQGDVATLCANKTVKSVEFMVQLDINPAPAQSDLRFVFCFECNLRAGGLLAEAIPEKGGEYVLQEFEVRDPQIEFVNYSSGEHRTENPLDLTELLERAATATFNVCNPVVEDGVRVLVADDKEAGPWSDWFTVPISVERDEGSVDGVVEVRARTRSGMRVPASVRSNVLRFKNEGSDSLI